MFALMYALQQPIKVCLHRDSDARGLDISLCHNTGVNNYIR